MNEARIKQLIYFISDYETKPEGFLKECMENVIPEYAREISIYFQIINTKRTLDKHFRIMI
jgi:hypothetical protein